jgi:hypothetical protein
VIQQIAAEGVSGGATDGAPAQLVTLSELAVK